MHYQNKIQKEEKKKSSKAEFSAEKKPMKIDSADSAHEKEAESDAVDIIHGDQLMMRGSESSMSNSESGANMIMPQREESGNEEMYDAPQEVEQGVEQTKGKGAKLPDGMRKEAEASLGADFKNVQVHTDSKAADMNENINAKAFTHGQDIYFGQGEFNPSSREGKHLLLHELGHARQQNADGGNGKENIIQRYVRYERPDQLRKKAGDKNFDKYQDRKKKKPEKNKKMLQGWRHPDRKPLIVSNDGKMVVEGTQYKTAKLAWADKNLIDQANKILLAQKSYIKLEEEANDLVIGNVPKDGSENTSKTNFKKIKVVHDGKDLTVDANTDKMKFQNDPKPRVIDDCGVACGLIIGSTQVTSEGDKTKTGDDALPQATPYQRFLVSGGVMKGKISVAYNDPNKDMKSFIQKIMLNEDAYKNISDVSSSNESAYKKYMTLPTVEKDSLDKKYGLNKYARPSWGQGVTIDNPNFDAMTKEKEKQASQKKQTEIMGNSMSSSTPTTNIGGNFHYASNIMESDSDYMSFEAYAGSTNWFFFMYGEDKGQSFYEIHSGDFLDDTAVGVSATDPQVGAQH